MKLKERGNSITFPGDAERIKMKQNRFLELFSKKAGTITIEKVWENVSPTSAFTAKTITIDKSDYDYIMILFRIAPTAPGSTFFFSMNDNNMTTALNITTAAEGIYYYRRSVKTNGDQVTFGSGELKSLQAGTIKSDDTANIPYRIYGIKGVQ